MKAVFIVAMALSSALSRPAAAEPARPQPGSVFRDCPECPEMVTIPAGSFTMGSPAGESGRSGYEGPQRRVTITAAFGLGKYEATFEEWDACVRDNGCATRATDINLRRGRQPVINVSWVDAKQYVAWLSRKSGNAYRLPSEAEWEYAARAGTTTAYSTGEAISQRQANYSGGAGRPVPVGLFAGNRFGLHDMHGNVWEWVEDCWNDSYVGAPTDSHPWLIGYCGARVVRGGSWIVNPRLLRSATRFALRTGNRAGYLGFRVARTF